MLPDRVRVQHMIDAARQAVEFTSGRSRADLDENAMLALALTRLLEILGEAAKHVSPATRALAPELPWRQVTGTCDRIAHGYFEINLDLVWRIVTAELPALQPDLERLLARID
jgi:uncharacterized protein with HEPN domain